MKIVKFLFLNLIKK